MLSNTATPRYYGEFRQKVLRGEIPVCYTISMEMNRIDQLIDNRGVYYDEDTVEGWIAFCENELTLTDGSDFHMLDSFKLWGEEIFGWYYFVDKEVWEPDGRGGGHYVTKRVKKRLTNKQYLIVGRGAAKSLYDTDIHAYFLTIDKSTTHQITTAPTMKQADEVMAPLRTAITRARGPYFKFLTETKVPGAASNKTYLCSTKRGIEDNVTGSLLEIRPMSIDKLQGLRTKINSVDEWLSGDTNEDVVGAIEQGASKKDDYLIRATSPEGTVRNGPGDTIKMELMDILKGKYFNPHTSIWWYRLDDVKEVGDPSKWIKANPNIGKTVQYEVYQQEVERAENAPATRNDILAKRFGIPMEGYTYYFTYEETIPHRKHQFYDMPCSGGADLSQGGDFCAFTFLFPLSDESFGVKCRSYISELTYQKLPRAMKEKYDEFIAEDSLVVMPGTIINTEDVYDDLIKWLDDNHYDCRTFGYDPYNARDFVERWCSENGSFGVEKVIQGAKTESVPLTELKNLASERMLIFDEKIMQFTMGNAITIEDTNGNKKLLKKRYEAKIDNVSAMMDAFVAFKLNRDAFE